MTFDAIVIGAGQAGVPLARGLAEAGWKTALVESTHIGGTCVNEGCTPTKTMVASARVAHLARRGADYGVKGCDVSIDMTVVRKRKRDIVESFRGGSQKRLEKTKNLELIFGEAAFTGPHEVRVGDRTLSAARAVVINTGTRAAVPAIPGLDVVMAGGNVLDNRSIMELDSVPEHLLVLGGGYIGLEFGQMFRRFGSRVTIVQSNARLLPREDEDVSDKVAEILKEDGIEVITSAKARQVEAGILLTIATPTGEHYLTGSHLLLATGRTPNTDRLNLAAAGVAIDKHGYIKANDRLQTSAPDIYAAGDVKGGPAFTHISYDDFRILKARFLDGEDSSIAGRILPYTLYIDPQLGRIGITEREARAQNLDFRVFKMPMTSVARALETDETRGFMKALVDNKTGQILGATVLGIEGGETATLIQMAMMGKLSYTVLRDGIFSHPTLAESLNNLFA